MIWFLLASSTTHLWTLSSCFLRGSWRKDDHWMVLSCHSTPSLPSSTPTVPVLLSQQPLHCHPHGGEKIHLMEKQLLVFSHCHIWGHAKNPRACSRDVHKALEEAHLLAVTTGEPGALSTVSVQAEHREGCHTGVASSEQPGPTLCSRRNSQITRGSQAANLMALGEQSIALVFLRVNFPAGKDSPGSIYFISIVHNAVAVHCFYKATHFAFHCETQTGCTETWSFT